MPRYYFDLEGECPTIDPRGLELEGIEEAEAEAI